MLALRVRSATSARSRSSSPQTARDASDTWAELGAVGTIALLLKAFSLGGGTYTGIEAVSNGLQILREPRVQTGKRTMIYMALSLVDHGGRR